jgi:hypothetical protein
MAQQINDHLVMVCGKSTTGKSASLMGLTNPEGVMYLNCESGKRLPFPAKFKVGPDGRPGYIVTDPLQVREAFQAAEGMTDVTDIVVDSATFMMEMYESVHVTDAANTMKAWGDFAQFWKNLMQQDVARSTKNVVFTAHTLDTYNEKDMCMETKVPIKGSLKNVGLESFFSVVIATKRLNLSALESRQCEYLKITPSDESLGFKHVFQTQLTKETVNERIRGPIGMWQENETYIDNNMQFVFDRLRQYYA